MVAQALPLVLLAEAMGMSIPFVTDYYKEKGIDLSGYDANDLVPLEVLLPEQAHMKELKSQRDWSQSYYQPKPVVGDTDLSGVVVQSEKDDDEVIDVTEEDLEVMPRTDVSTEGEEPPEDPVKKFLREMNKRTLEELVRFLSNKALDAATKKLIKAEINSRKKQKTDAKSIVAQKIESGEPIIAVDEAMVADRLNRKLNRISKMEQGKGDPGKPKNKFKILPSSDPNLPDFYVGDAPLDVQFKFITEMLNTDEINAASEWYTKSKEVYLKLGPLDKDAAMENMVLSIFGALRTSPNMAYLNAIRAREIKQGLDLGKKAGIQHEVLMKILSGEEIEKGVGQKLFDFMDSHFGNETRTFYGNNEKAGEPYTVDSIELFMSGYNSPAKYDILKKLGYNVDELIPDFKRQPSGMVTDSPSEVMYERTADKGRNFTAYFNEQMGTNYSASQIQAIRWQAAQKLLTGRVGETPESAILSNILYVPFEINPSTSSKLSNFSEIYKKLPYKEQRTIHDAGAKLLIETLDNLIGIDIQNVIHGTGNWQEDPPVPNTTLQLLNTPAKVELMNNIIGYIATQDEVLYARIKDYMPQKPESFVFDIKSKEFEDSKVADEVFEALHKADKTGTIVGSMIAIDPEDKVPILRIAITKGEKTKGLMKYLADKGGMQNAVSVLEEDVVEHLTNKVLKQLEFNTVIDLYAADVQFTGDGDGKFWEGNNNGNSYIQRISEIATPELAKAVVSARTNYLQELAKEIEGITGQDIYKESGTKFSIEDLESIISTIQLITDGGDTPLLPPPTKNLKLLKRRGGMIEIPHFHYGGFIDVNRL